MSGLGVSNLNRSIHIPHEKSKNNYTPVKRVSSPIRQTKKRLRNRSYCTLSLSKRSIWQPDEDIDSYRPIEEQGYYHGVVPRTDAEELLKINGEFLVRKTAAKNGAPIVTVKWSGKTVHYTIKCEHGYYFIHKQKYKSLQELFFNLYCNQKPLAKGTGALLLYPKRLELWEITEDQISISEKKIGKGHFGDVYLGTMQYNYATIPIAIKMSNKQDYANPTDKEQFMKEVRTMKQYHHPNIVQFYGVTISKDPMMILMEYVNGGSLLDLLRDPKEDKALYFKLRLMLQAAKGMSYLADQNCIHRDLAARNCLVMRTTKCLKISDFGLSRQGNKYKMQSRTAIPLRWTAPEAFMDHTFTHKSDVWSFGILCWEIFNEGKVPYSNLQLKATAMKTLGEYLLQGNRLSTSNIPPEIATKVESYWRQNSEKRPTFREIKLDLEQCLYNLK